MAWDIWIKGNHFVWLLWQNFNVEICENTSKERRSYEAPAGNEDPAELASCQFIAPVAIFISLVEPF